MDNLQNVIETTWWPDRFNNKSTMLCFFETFTYKLTYLRPQCNTSKLLSEEISINFCVSKRLSINLITASPPPPLCSRDRQYYFHLFSAPTLILLIWGGGVTLYVQLDHCDQIG